MAARRRPEGSSTAAKPADLMQVALAKLDQRDQTREQLRQVLERKASRAASSAAGGDERTPVELSSADQARIDEVLTRLESSGVINDRRFAEHFVRGARSRGASAAKVQHKLGQRGVERDEIDQALGALASEGQDDLFAAKTYARKRRLAERYDLSVPKEREKALASLARQGFSLSTALRALETERDD